MVGEDGRLDRPFLGRQGRPQQRRGRPALVQGALQGRLPHVPRRHPEGEGQGIGLVSVGGRRLCLPPGAVQPADLPLPPLDGDGRRGPPAGPAPGDGGELPAHDVVPEGAEELEPALGGVRAEDRGQLLSEQDGVALRDRLRPRWRPEGEDRLELLRSE